MMRCISLFDGALVELVVVLEEGETSGFGCTRFIWGCGGWYSDFNSNFDRRFNKGDLLLVDLV